MSDEELAQRVKMIEAALTLALTLWCLWSMIPQHRRQLWRMSLLARLHRSMGWAARRTGAGSMRAELASGQENYVLPYALSVCRDQIAAMYDRARGVTP